MSASRKKILVLDFDGVICDSTPECLVTSLHAWQIYAEEFKQALEIATNKKVLLDNIKVTDFISPFEKKYYDSGHELYRVTNST